MSSCLLACGWSAWWLGMWRDGDCDCGADGSGARTRTQTRTASGASKESWFIQRLPHFNGNRDRCRRYHNSDVPYCMSWLRQLVSTAWSCSSGQCEKLSGHQSLLCIMLGRMFKLKSCKLSSPTIEIGSFQLNLNPKRWQPIVTLWSPPFSGWFHTLESAFYGTASLN